MQPAAADLQLQLLWARAELHREQKPVRVPGPELEANGDFPRGGRSCRERQEAAAAAQKGAGHQLGLRTREGHVALEDKMKKERKKMQIYRRRVREAAVVGNSQRCVWKCHVDAHRQ